MCVLSLFLKMIQEMASGNKGDTPDMGDLSDVSAVRTTVNHINI